MTKDMALEAAARSQLWVWGTAFFLGTFGVAGAGLLFDMPKVLTVALFLAAMSLLVPFVRASERYQKLTGSGSVALRRYARQFMVASFAYIITLIGAIWLSQNGSYPRPVFILIAIAPALPVLGMIWTMARLIIDEQDEYLRANYVRDALFATGLMLAMATTWGFLEMFEVVPHFPSWWVFPAWAFSLGIGQMWRKARS